MSVFPGCYSAWRGIVNQALQRQETIIDGAWPVCGGGPLLMAFTIDDPARCVAPEEWIAGQGHCWEWYGKCQSFDYYNNSLIPEWASGATVSESLGLCDPSEVARLLAKNPGSGSEQLGGSR
ncbi:hypothetical protein [Kitasatospora sp. NPDC059327]|uniref:hypothetical protein n=1 Tax=Kitasatospora sp. NPDC059327 TaxID=3346803 RepID=UPI0036A326FB